MVTALWKAMHGGSLFWGRYCSGWQAFKRRYCRLLAPVIFYLFFFLNSNFTSRDCAATASQSFGSWSWCSPIEGQCCLSNHAAQVKIASAAACVQSCQAVMLEFQWVARWAEKVWLSRLFLLPSGHQCSRAKSEKPWMCDPSQPVRFLCAYSSGKMTKSACGLLQLL